MSQCSVRSPRPDGLPCTVLLHKTNALNTGVTYTGTRGHNKGVEHQLTAQERLPAAEGPLRLAEAQALQFIH